MKSITLFITSLAQGGAEHQLLILGDQLIKRGYKVSLVTYLDIPDHYIPNNLISRIRIAEGKNKISKVLGILNYFRKVNTNVVISYAEKNNFLAILGLLGRKKIRILVSERNYFINNGFFMKLLRKVLYKKADAIIPNSHSQGKFLKSLGNNIRNKVYTITNYTDINKYLPSKINRENKSALRLCVFARYNPQKNYIRLAKAINELKKVTQIRFTIDWYGKNTDATGNYNKYFLEFQSYIKILNIEDIIHLNGPTKKVESLFPHYDAFLLPSLYEGFSNALSEAISSGLPCIVSDVSDNCLMVENRINGFLFNPLDEHSIKDALNKFQSSTSEEIKNFSINSRKKAESIFNINHFTEQYIKLIQDDTY